MFERTWRGGETTKDEKEESCYKRDAGEGTVGGAGEHAGKDTGHAGMYFCLGDMPRIYLCVGAQMECTAIEYSHLRQATSACVKPSPPCSGTHQVGILGSFQDPIAMCKPENVV